MNRFKQAIILAVAAIAASACATDVDSFAKNAARHLCKNYEDCNKAAFDEVYNDDRGMCRNETEATILAAARDCEDQGCTYDEDAASDCYKAIRKHKRDCNVDAAVFDRCNDIYDCPDDAWCSLAGIRGTYDQRSEPATTNPLIPSCDHDDLEFDRSEPEAQARHSLDDEFELAEFEPDAEAPLDIGADRQDPVAGGSST